MAKRPVTRESDATPADTSEPLPLVWGFGLEPRAGGFVACRISTDGAREYIGPKTTGGGPRPESKPAALGRMYEAMKQAYSPARNMRFA